MSQHKDENIFKACALLKSLAHPARMMILCLLNEKGEMTVSDILAHSTGMISQSQLSQYLNKMRLEGLLSHHKKGQYVYYKIKSKEAKKLIHTLYKIYCH